mmetsp:Transcript_12075/g.37240  ORF Transcript_12075/g.37240 Transcript_12075/m.37240 type:complete len:241 (+) Transcript_12075:768-1490(+)
MMPAMTESAAFCALHSSVNSSGKSLAMMSCSTMSAQRSAATAAVSAKPRAAAAASSLLWAMSACGVSSSIEAIELENGSISAAASRLLLARLAMRASDSSMSSACEREAGMSPSFSFPSAMSTSAVPPASPARGRSAPSSCRCWNHMSASRPHTPTSSSSVPLSSRTTSTWSDTSRMMSINAGETKRPFVSALGSSTWSARAMLPAHVVSALRVRWTYCSSRALATSLSGGSSSSAASMW